MAYDVVLTANYSPWSRYHGGLQKSVDQLALAMSHLGVRVGVVYSRTPWERIQIPDRPYGLHWVFFHAIRPGISSPGRIFNSFPFVRLLQKITGPATVIQGNGDEAWNFPRFFPGRFVYTHRQPFFPDYLQGDWTSRSHRIRILFRENREWAYARAVLGANQVTCTSQFNAEKLQSLFRLTRIPQVVPNGIAPEFLVAPLEARGHHILYFGRLSRGKGVVELCEAWNSLPSVLRRQHPLHLVGHGELIKTIQMKFRGFAPDLRPVLRGALEGKTLATEVATAALIVLPSQSESFGNTMLEALATGQRIITCRTGAIPEVIGPHADFIAHPVPRDLRDLIQRRLKEDSEKETRELREARREWVRERFSWKQSARLFLHGYEQLHTKFQ